MPAFDETLLEPAFDESLLVPETRPERGQRLRTELAAVRQEPAALSSPNAPAPPPVSTFQGASETTLMPAGEEYRQFRLPRAGAPGIQPVTTFQGPSEVTLMPEQQARTTGEIMQNATAAGIEGLVSPMTPPIILGTVAAPQIAVPLLTATMAKSGSTKLAQGIEDLQQGRHAEGVAKLGESATELGFAAAPALHPSLYARRPTVELPESLRAAAEEPIIPTEPPPEPGAPTAPQPTTPVAGGPNASSQPQATEVHGDLRPSTGEGAGQVPAAQGVGGVQPRTGAPDTGVRAGNEAQAQAEVPLTEAAPPVEETVAPTQIVGKVRGMSEDDIRSAIMQAVVEGGMVKGLKRGAEKEGHYVVVPPDKTVPGDEPMAMGPFESKQGAQEFLDSEVGAPGAKVVEVRRAAAAPAARAEEAPAAPPVEPPKPAAAPAPEPEPAPVEAPPAAAPTGPALTLLGLSEDKFALPSLRKLSRDTIRRLANSLGTDATVPAVARRAAERFAEMRAQPPGPVGMGGALASEMSGEQPPLASTPAHAVETGPLSERPLGLIDPTSSPFVSLSLEMLGQPSSVPPEYSVDTGLKSQAGHSAPRLTAMNRPAGEALVRYASSKIAAPYKALVFSSRVLEKGVNAVKFGAALVEDNLRSIEQEFLRQANESFEKGDQATADSAYEKALNVRSIVGGKNSPFKTEQEYQDFLHDPLTQEAVKRHVQLWQEDIEPQYKMAQSLDPDVELPTRGQQTGARINLKAILEGDEPGTRPVTASRGGLAASFKRKSPFARAAKGTGDIYESNYPDIIANTYRRQLEIANQNEMNRVLVANDLARIDKPGARVMFGDKPGVPFPLTRRLLLTGGEAIPAGQNIYVRPEFAREYRTALNVDAPDRIPFFTELSGLFTRASIAGLGELTTHISNLATGLFTRPNSPLLWDTLAKATGRADVPITIVRALLKAAADNREQVAKLAEIGVIREPQGKAATSPYRLLNAVNMVRGAPRQLIHWADTTVRLTLDDAYKGLADAGLAENTETARREFVNQVGQYNKRLQGQFTVWLRDTGFGPFVTAGKTFNAMGIRNMLLSPGLKATSPMAAAALHANALAGWVGFVTLTATLNWLLTRNKGGGVMGRSGVPIGNIDTGTDDEQGKPISLPLADALGYGRGLRITGARRLIEGARYGIDQNQALDSALGDVVNAAISPALGPIIRSGFAAVTGRPPALNVGRTAPVVGPQQSQFAANVLDALRRANPLVNAAYDVREGKSGLDIARSQAQRFSPQAGMAESKAEALPRIISRARLNDFIDDLSRRARRLPLADRAAFIRDEMEKAELSGADRVRAHRQIQERTRYP